MQKEKENTTPSAFRLLIRKIINKFSSCFSPQTNEIIAENSNYSVSLEDEFSENSVEQFNSSRTLAESSRKNTISKKANLAKAENNIKPELFNHKSINEMIMDNIPRPDLAIIGKFGSETTITFGDNQLDNKENKNSETIKNSVSDFNLERQISYALQLLENSNDYNNQLNTSCSSEFVNAEIVKSFHRKSMLPYSNKINKIILQLNERLKNDGYELLPEKFEHEASDYSNEAKNLLKNDLETISNHEIIDNSSKVRCSIEINYAPNIDKPLFKHGSFGNENPNKHHYKIHNHQTRNSDLGISLREKTLNDKLKKLVKQSIKDSLDIDGANQWLLTHDQKSLSYLLECELSGEE